MSPPTLDDLRNCGQIYLATPYTRYPHGAEMAYIHAKDLTAQIFKRHGLYTYSPIAYGHLLAPYLGIHPFDHARWTEFNLPAIAASHVLLVAMLDGWQESIGIADEIQKFFKRPRFFINPETLELSNV